jgi:hypothetical protein
MPTAFSRTKVAASCFRPLPLRCLNAQYQLHDEAERSHDAELGDLVHQDLESVVVVADETQLALSSRPVNSRLAL